MRWASNAFSVEEYDPRVLLKKITFFDGMRGSDRIARSKTLGSKTLLFISIRKPDFVSYQKPAFSIRAPDCVRTGLTRKHGTKQIVRFFRFKQATCKNAKNSMLQDNNPDAACMHVHTYIRSFFFMCMKERAQHRTA